MGNGTEEDTFRKLKQTPYKEMRKLLTDYPVPAKERTAILKQNGWTLTEYQEANHKFWESLGKSYATTTKWALKKIHLIS